MAGFQLTTVSSGRAPGTAIHTWVNSPKMLKTDPTTPKIKELWSKMKCSNATNLLVVLSAAATVVKDAQGNSIK